MPRVWQNYGGLAISADNLNSLEADVATALGREPALPMGTSAQYLRGDKTLQTLNKTAVGLGNVDNTADTAKPVSELQAAAIAAAKLDMQSKIAQASGVGRVTVGGIRVTPGVDTRYSAFPVQCKLNDGRIFMVWYEATDHITTRDGIVVGSYSSDNGLTWSAKQTFFSIPGIDLRDPTVSTSADGNILYLTYIKCTAAKPRDGFFLRRSENNGATWGPEIRIDPVGSNGAGTAPILEMADGRTIAVWFGMLDGETWDSSWRAYSSDKGLTWSAPERFNNGQADSRGYAEPYAAVYKNNVVIMYRHGEIDQLGITRSTNNGSTWSTPAASFIGTGRPTCVLTSKGTLIVVFRDKADVASSQHAVMRTSTDLGLTWTPYKLVERADPNWMLYSCPTEVAPGVIMCSTALEHSTTSGSLSIRYLIEGGGISPFGDVVAPLDTKAVNRRGTLAIVDSFDRADTTNGVVGRSENGMKWVSPSPGPFIQEGALYWSGSTSSFLTVGSVLSADMEVEADLQWTTNAGVYVVARYNSANDYLMAGIESNGVALRLYKVVAGVTTQIGAGITVSAPAGVYHKVKLTCLGDNLRLYFEDDLVLTASDAAHNTRVWAGVRTGLAGSSVTHRVRNFVARRRSGRLA